MSLTSAHAPDDRSCTTVAQELLARPQRDGARRGLLDRSRLRSGRSGDVDEIRSALARRVARRPLMMAGIRPLRSGSLEQLARHGDLEGIAGARGWPLRGIAFLRCVRGFALARLAGGRESSACRRSRRDSRLPPSLEGPRRLGNLAERSRLEGLEQIENEIFGPLAKPLPPHSARAGRGEAPRQFVNSRF